MRRPRKAFTLVELLVVIGIIAVLIAILLPSLNRARDQANRIKCQSNLRNLLNAVIMYANENKQWMPYCNWVGTPPGHVGWLYQDPFVYDPAHVETGSLFQYLKTRELYKCPSHTELRTVGPTTELITSYLMNGAVQNFGQHRTVRITKFKVTDVIFWESGETSLMNNGPPFNDGSSFPGEWLSERHGGRTRGAGNVAEGSGGASIGCIDGHTEWMAHDEYLLEEQNGPGRFWCAPDLPRGGRP